ncbi:hypothetical protein Q7A53_05205 [Halobacillus rhizosphaerae]|uniref:hypothetical protein n=1 Tax=Halobacillus rhizosphaerae TaxID=3064889 RepID=UPI00398AC2FC
MAYRNQWDEMTEEERIEYITPFLEELKKTIISEDTLSYKISTIYNDERNAPEFLNGYGEPIKGVYVGIDKVEIELTKIKHT